MGEGETEAGPVLDPRVLGWFLTTLNVVQVLPTTRRLGEFLAGVLTDIPGVARGGLCLSDPLLEICQGACGALDQGAARTQPGGCADDEATRIALDTSRHAYGHIVLEVDDPVRFRPYEPFVANFAGSLALLLENRQQRNELEAALDRSEESERKYRQLFTEMNAGHALHEIILDDDGRPCDYRFLEVNPAFEQLTGLRAADIVGKRVREVLPGIEAPWVERYGRVALTGEPTTFEDYNRDLDRYYSVVAYRPEPGHFAVIFSDVSEPRRLAAELQVASAELTELNEELQRQNEELQAAQREAARLLDDQRSLFHRLQGALLDIPKELPGVRFGHLYRSATSEAEIGGDFYDVFGIRDGRVGVLIGDVSGHGVEAARLATLVKDTVHAFTHQFMFPHLVLQETNQLLVEKGLPGFVSTFLGFLDSEGERITYCSAGHPSPLLKCGGRVSFLESFNIPLGVFADARYEASEEVIPAGCLLLLYTDGLTEVRRGKELFGEGRLAEAVLRRRGEAVDTLPAALLEEALSFSGGRLDDDVAVLAVRYEGTGRPTGLAAPELAAREVGAKGRYEGSPAPMTGLH